MRVQARPSFLILAAFFLTVTGATASDIDGRWEGKISVPGQPLEIAIGFATSEDGALSGEISIPVQGISDLALTEITLDAGKIAFEDRRDPGHPWSTIVRRHFERRRRPCRGYLSPGRQRAALRARACR